MKRLLRLALLLYPRSWRDRYGDEFELLLAQVAPSWRVVLDTASSALVARARSLSLEAIRARARTLAVVALAIVLPTTTLVVVAVLKYIAGIPGPFDALEPSVTPLVTHPLGETVFVLAPYVGLLLAVLPVTRVELGWRDQRVAASVHVVAPAVNLFAAALCAALIVVMILYWVAENL